MMANDVLHEIEQGWAKQLLLHAFRLIETVKHRGGKGRLQVLNNRRALLPAIRFALIEYRFRDIPRYHSEVLRSFGSSLTSASHLQAHHWEDIIKARRGAALLCSWWPLQCCIAVFEGMLKDPLETLLTDALVAMTELHALAKLHMHTDTTMMHLQTAVNEVRTRSTRSGALLLIVYMSVWARPCRPR
jgi:hypothetical protein